MTISIFDRRVIKKVTYLLLLHSVSSRSLTAGNEVAPLLFLWYAALELGDVFQSIVTQQGEKVKKYKSRVKKLTHSKGGVEK